MSALAEALEHVQRRAVAALAKQYVGGQLDSVAVLGFGLAAFYLWIGLR